MEEEKEELSPKELVNFGSSLLVPSVQELAKQHINTDIPARYIRFDQESPITSTTLHPTCLPRVPVIDIHSLLSQESYSSEAAATELDRLHSACKNWGFFQIINHVVSTSLIEKIKLEIKDLFELPVEEKQKLWQQPGDQEGFGQLFVVSEDQKLDWSDMFFITTLPTTIRKPKFFEKLPLSLRETLEIYSLEVQKLAMTVLGQMAKALKMDAEEMRQLFDDGFQAMRLNYYPLCSQPEKAIGFTPHSDSCALTILLQLNETEGLQIRNEGKWIPVKPLPNAFVVNIGDIMEIVSNGVYRSIEHRVVVNSTKERLSIATFYSTNIDAEIGPAHSCIEPHKPALFKRVMTDKYFKDFFARELKGKSYLDSLRINPWSCICDEITADMFDSLFRKKNASPYLFMDVFQGILHIHPKWLQWAESELDRLENYSLEMQKLAMTVLGQMAKALKMDAEEMRQLFNVGFQAMRLNYYPLCSQPEKAIGFTPHSDASALTILLQLNETEGLQIRNEGKWIPVKPLPNAFVVNIGDIMEIVSNGVYHSIEHRAVVNSTKERLSIATFYRTNLEAEIGPAPSLIEPHKPALFKRVMAEKYFKDFFAREIKGKSYLDSMRINGTGEEKSS